MDISAKPVSVPEIRPWRDLYRQEMNCQIVHDSLHAREGWTQPYMLEVGGQKAGYGSLLIGGPWAGTRTAFEFYVLPGQRSSAFDLFACLLAASGATAIEAQTNDALVSAMLHTWGHDIKSGKIVFEDQVTTFHTADGATLRNHEGPDADWALDVDGAVAATGGLMFHYNRPYGDIYMQVAGPFRRRGFGTYLV